jgi:hypothetical protein
VADNHLDRRQVQTGQPASLAALMAEAFLSNLLVDSIVKDSADNVAVFHFPIPPLPLGEG